jgi:hypothetical protein
MSADTTCVICKSPNFFFGKSSMEKSPFNFRVKVIQAVENLWYDYEKEVDEDNPLDINLVLYFANEERVFHTLEEAMKYAHKLEKENYLEYGIKVLECKYPF